MKTKCGVVDCSRDAVCEDIEDAFPCCPDHCCDGKGSDDCRPMKAMERCNQVIARERFAWGAPWEDVKCLLAKGHAGDHRDWTWWLESRAEVVVSEGPDAAGKVGVPLVSAAAGYQAELKAPQNDSPQGHEGSAERNP